MIRVRRSVRFWSQKRRNGGDRGRLISSGRCRPLLRVFVVSGSLRPAGVARDNQNPFGGSIMATASLQNDTDAATISATFARRDGVVRVIFSSEIRQARASHWPNSTCSRVQLHMLGDTCLRTRQRPSLHWCDGSQGRMRTSKHATERSSAG